ncbi:MAG: aminotransferase class V-fold PLP-dependent enzyme [Gammaproteobacteria bacterium]|nr:aminotransferase class V-fold PLP-dependent enzyme [Gammaproteobacteria bacterium]
MNLKHEFPLNEDIIYLNHAGVGPWPRRTAEAVQRFAEENMTRGSRNYMQWAQRETHLREQLRALLNAPDKADIALLKNTSEALSAVAYGVDWRRGDNVVITDQEFPSNRIVWESLHSQGVTVREADVSNPETAAETSLFALTDEHTRLLSVSSVQYASGLRLDLEKIGKFCRERNILFCVDAIQSLGAEAMDVQACHIDFLMADGHKWMLSPEGLAVFYCNPARREQLRLKQFGWHMVEDHLDFEARTWKAADSARRFECGSPNMLGVHALSASLSLLEETGMQTVKRQVLKNTRFLLDALSQSADIQILSVRELERCLGIVTFRSRRAPSTILDRYLSGQGVVCAQRGGGVRFSPHFYTPRQQLERAVELVLACPPAATQV